MPTLRPALVAALISLPVSARGQSDYLVFVAAEAADRISLIRWGPAGARVERDLPIGINPMDPDGPHGLAVSPDGAFLYVSTAHGNPFGYLWKLDAASGRVAGRVELGNFPASLDLTPDGAYALVVNFNLHGDMVPSSVSVVSTTEMVEVARLTTCAMPHGSRLIPQGDRHYSVCMMDDILVEIDARQLAVSRHFMLARGSEHGMDGPPRHRGMPGDHQRAEPPTCSPTWAQPAPTGDVVYVACNRSNEIVAVDARSWSVRARWPGGDGVYNLGVTRDGRTLIATNKRARSVSLFDTASGRETARLATKRSVVHGVAVSPDDRYAFVSVEGVGSEPGTLEVVDLARRSIVASVDVGQMAGGVAFWRLEP
ncbi:MAG TPA: YncE family protein [Gemmatimonadales bacterium]|nr:YncE family protein [Gemmatimonadales bacterium]